MPYLISSPRDGAYMEAIKQTLKGGEWLIKDSSPARYFYS